MAKLVDTPVKSPVTSDLSKASAGSGVLKKNAVPGLTTPLLPKAVVPAAPKTTGSGVLAPGAQQGLNTPFVSSGGGGAAAPASATDDTDYLNGDGQYQLQLASLMKALSDEQADVTNQQTQYNTDYGTAVKNLGWEQPDPTNAADQGQWNFGDTNTAAGRAFQNQQNDFAGRGLLQSSAYGTANDNLTRSLNDQLSSTNTAKTNFLNNLAQTQQGFTTDNQNQQQQARIDALNRMAAGVSPVAV